MCKSSLTFLIVLIFLFDFIAVCQAHYSGGSGTEENPYQIATVADWQTLMNTSDDWNKHFILTADLDLKGVALFPIGNLSNMFTGVFDGNGHIISNAVINMPNSNYVGLFSCVQSVGQIRNLCINNIAITGKNYVGSLVGDNGGSLTDCCAIGSISGNKYVGGLVGGNVGGNLTNCSASGLVSGSEWSVGGLVGDTFFGSFIACYATSTVIGDISIGGLIGDNSYGNITTCYATGLVIGSADVGGLVGENSGGNLTDCYTTGTASGNQYVGGLVGFTYESANITNCYATSSVNGNLYVGGLVGYNRGCTIITCFWDVETSEQTTSDGGMDKTTAEMKTRSTFTNAGWDFVGEKANGTEDIWSICEGTDYPRLTWQIPAADWLCPDGVGMEDFSYLAQFWMIPEGGNNPADLDKDNAVGISDLIIFCEQWLSGR